MQKRNVYQKEAGFMYSACPSLRSYRAMLLLAGFLLTITGAVQAQEEPQDDQDSTTYTWGYKHKKGETYRVRGRTRFFVTRSDERSAEQLIEYITRFVVKDIAPNGEVTRTFMTTVNEHISNTRPRDTVDADLPGIQVLGKSGIVLHHKSQKETGGMLIYDQLAWTLNCCPLPPGPVKMGESWTTYVKNPMSPQSTWVLNSTLVGKEKVGGAETLMVKNETKATLSDEKRQETVRFDYICYIDPRKGKILRTLATIDNLYMKGPTTSSILSGEIEMTLMEDNVPKKKAKK